MIATAYPVQIDTVPLAKAKNISHLRAVFGEVYPDPVRVVLIGPALLKDVLSTPTNNQWSSLSIELCGGTHVTNTKEIIDFALMQESGIAKGIRRIVALTGKLACAARLASKEFSLKLLTVSKEQDSLSLTNETAFFAMDEKIKNLGKELESLDLPLINKLSYREKLLEMRRVWDDADKERKGEQNKKVSDLE